MRELHRHLTVWLVRNWFVLCVGMILTTIAMQRMYVSRGYFTIGSEWMIIPMCLAVRKFIRFVRRMI